MIRKNIDLGKSFEKFKQEEKSTPMSILNYKLLDNRNMQKIIIYTVTFPDKYLCDGHISFNWKERTCKFFDLDQKKYVTISVEDIDYLRSEN